MSIGFQKLNGDKTTAGKQLEILKQIESVSSKPEVWKLAKLYYPNLELTPITENWHWVKQGIARMKENNIYDLDGKYFGVWQINATMPDNAGGAQRRNYSNIMLYDGQEQTFNMAFGHIGNRSREDYQPFP